MSTDVDTVLDTSSLTDIDFEPAIPCESDDHAQMAKLGQAASWFAILKCPPCGDTLTRLLCDECRLRKLKGRAIMCNACGYLAENWLDFVLVLEPIGGPA